MYYARILASFNNLSKRKSEAINCERMESKFPFVDAMTWFCHIYHEKKGLTQKREDSSTDVSPYLYHIVSLSCRFYKHCVQMVRKRSSLRVFVLCCCSEPKYRSAAVGCILLLYRNVYFSSHATCNINTTGEERSESRVSNSTRPQNETVCLHTASQLLVLHTYPLTSASIHTVFI